MPYIVTNQLEERGSRSRPDPRSDASAFSAALRSPAMAEATATAPTRELSTALSVGALAVAYSIGSSSGSRPWYQRIATSWAAYHAWASASPALVPSS
jgi:hypothetical protein